MLAQEFRLPASSANRLQHNAASRRGCSVIMHSESDETPHFLPIHLKGREFERHMAATREKLARAEIQAQVLEISRVSGNRSAFARAGAAIAQLAHELPSGGLRNAAIQARNIADATHDSELVRINAEIATELGRLRSLLAVEYPS